MKSSFLTKMCVKSYGNMPWFLLQGVKVYKNTCKKYANLPWFLLEVIQFYKKLRFFSLVVKGILLYKIVLYFVLQNQLFHETPAKTEWLEHESSWIFQSRRDISGLWNDLWFFDLPQSAWTADAKIDQKHKKHFFNFLYFFSLSKVLSVLREFLKV